jgi:hypothetical protein
VTHTAQPSPGPPALPGLLPLLLCLPAALWAGPPSLAAAHAPDPGGTDSVLAVVTVRPAGLPAPGGSAPRTVTRAQFARAWAQLQPPVRPDSLTPSGARRFLDLLIGKEALGLMAANDRGPWTARDQAGFDALRDQLVIGAALDSALAATRGALGSAADSLDRQALGVLARERAVERLAVAWDDSLTARLARAFAALPRPTADSSAAAQLRMMGAMPAVDPADTGRVVARSSAGEYRVSELLGAWGRLSPIYRPRIADAGQVRDLVTNGLFERLLRRDAAARGLENHPAVLARLAAERERIDVSHLVSREVYGRVPTDSLTLLRFHREHERDWALPTRVRCLTLVLEDRAEAEEMAGQLRDGARAESLAARARRAGSHWLQDVRADGDSARFARVMRAGTGTVLGPDRTADGWEVTRVMAVLPGRVPAFAECRNQVLERWYAEEGERRMQALLDRARAAARVEVHAAALERLVADPPAGLRGGR